MASCQHVNNLMDSMYPVHIGDYIIKIHYVDVRSTRGRVIDLLADLFVDLLPLFLIVAFFKKKQLEKEGVDTEYERRLAIYKKEHVFARKQLIYEEAIPRKTKRNQINIIICNLADVERQGELCHTLSSLAKGEKKLFYQEVSTAQ